MVPPANPEIAYGFSKMRTQTRASTWNAIAMYRG